MFLQRYLNNVGLMCSIFYFLFFTIIKLWCFSTIELPVLCLVILTVIAGYSLFATVIVTWPAFTSDSGSGSRSRCSLCVTHRVETSYFLSFLPNRYLTDEGVDECKSSSEKEKAVPDDIISIALNVSLYVYERVLDVLQAVRADLRFNSRWFLKS